MGITRTVVLGGALVTVIAGCGAETRQKLLSTFFEGSDTPPPPVTRVRRDFGQEIENLKRQIAEVQAAAQAGQGGGAQAADIPVEHAKTWEAAVALLPKTADGDVDWAEALRSGTIAPRPSPYPNVQPEAILSFDVIRIPAEAGDAAKAVFPHEDHTAVLACSSCHPAPFEMRKGATPMSMEKINAGEGCGVCHGTVAFPLTACARCHPAMGGG